MFFFYYMRNSKARNIYRALAQLGDWLPDLLESAPYWHGMALAWHVLYEFTGQNCLAWEETKRDRVELQVLLSWLVAYLSSPSVASILVFPLPVNSSHHPATSKDPSGCDFLWLATRLQKYSAQIKKKSFQTETIILIWAKALITHVTLSEYSTGALFTWINSQLFQLLANIHCRGDASASLLLPCVLNCPSLCAYCSGVMV